MSDPSAELRAALETCALVDRAPIPRILGSGPDLLDLLHRLSTNAMRDLAPGRGRATVLTTPKGRIAHRLVVHRLPVDGTLLVGGHGGAGAVLDHLARYTFGDQLGLTDVTAQWGHLAMIGPRASSALEAAALPVPSGYDCRPGTLSGSRVVVAGGDGIGAHGYSVFVPEPSSHRPILEELARAVAGQEGCVAGDEASEAWRVLRMLPAAGAELTEEHNPLEAALRAEIDFAKGCYVGQEVVARLNTYDKVARRLVRLSLPPGAPTPQRGTPVAAEGREIGKITSVAVPPGHGAPVALAFLRREHAMAGRHVDVAGHRAAVEAIAT